MTKIVIPKTSPRTALIDSVISSLTWKIGKTMEPSKKSTWKMTSTKSMSTLILKNRSLNTIKLKKFSKRLVQMSSVNYLLRSTSVSTSLTISTFSLSSSWCFPELRKKNFRIRVKKKRSKTRRDPLTRRHTKVQELSWSKWDLWSMW